jgi:serine/threonine protein kinase
MLERLDDNSELDVSKISLLNFSFDLDLTLESSFKTDSDVSKDTLKSTGTFAPTVLETVHISSGFGMSLRGISYEDLVFPSRPIKLGAGCSGTVFKAKLFNRVVAVKKIIGLTTISEGVKEEAAMQVQLQHPNIIALLGVVYDVPTKQQDDDLQDYWLVLEFASRGSVADIVHDKNHKYELRHMLKWAQDACLGLAYLHTRIVPLLHRDFKVLNLDLTV